MDMHDAMLFEILEEKKTIINFLDAIFGFLARRTDFYVEMKNASDVGFAPGLKEKIVYSALKKYDPKFQYTPAAATAIGTMLPSVQNEIEVETSQQDEIIESNEKITNTAKGTKDVMKTAESFFQPNEYYNGSKFDTYCWSQTITDLEIHVRLPEHIKTAKSLNVQISLDYLKIQEKDTNNVILEGKMIHKCKNNDAVWNISNGKLQMTLDKIQELWWDRLFDNEPKTDVSKIDCSRKIDELSEDQQAALERLQWDEQQTLLGLPTSEQIKNMEYLRKAWYAEGSPFKGQPFDPSLVRFD